MKNKAPSGNKRHVFQAVWTLLTNANLKGFFTGRIFTGASKNICVPGLNCYSCPGAIGACPIGSLQSFLSSYKFKFPYYVAGLLIFFGAVLGRAVCGLFCPFGLIQDLLWKIPFVHKITTFKGDKPLRKLKYVILAVMVLALPIFVKLTPVFCKYLCPAGTLSGVLLIISDSSLLSLLGGRFAWKFSILLIILFLSVVIFRPFCRYLCPLGAIYGFFNKIALYRYFLDAKGCIHCGKCDRGCPMDCSPSKDPNSSECIRCGKCIEVCPVNAIASSLSKPETEYIPDKVQ